MGNATSSPKEIKFSHNHAESGAWQHNGPVHGGATYNFHTQEDKKGREERIKEEKENAKLQEKLQSLSFPEMDYRRQAIPEAAEKTFSWLLEEESSPLRKWMTEADAPNLFWISGKAGSGKSTLMKLIGDHRETHSCLQMWAATRERKLFTAHHFFWYAGTPLQKSRKGLLQTLLYQLAQTDRSLMRILCHERLSSDLGHTRPWSTTELWDCFMRLENVKYAVFCIFVDGLDEFTPSDEHTQLARDISQLSALPNVRLCVSSRPWSAFERIFVNQIHCPHMKLEDLTRNDVRQFAIARMQAAHGTIAAASANDLYILENYTSIIDTLVEKANGVFLWVRLVVASLCERIIVESSNDELWHCLNEFPSELEVFLRDMIYGRIGPTWISGSETAKCLQLALLLQARKGKVGNQSRDGAIDSDSFLFYLAMQDLSWTWDAVAQYPYADLPTSYVGKRLTAWELKIESSCQGLLSVQRRNEVACCGSIDFSHRTVFDFLVSEEMQATLKTKVPAFFYQSDFIHMLLVASSKVAGTAHESKWPSKHLHQVWHMSKILDVLQHGKDASIAFQTLEQIAIEMDNRLGLPQLLMDQPYSERQIWGNDTSIITFITSWPQHGLFEYTRRAIARQPHVAMTFASHHLMGIREGWLNPQHFSETGLRQRVDLFEHLINHGADARGYGYAWSLLIKFVGESDQNQGVCLRGVWDLSRLLITNGILSCVPEKHYKPEGVIFVGLQKCAAVGGLDKDALEAFLKTFSDQQKLEEIHSARARLRDRIWPNFGCRYRCWMHGETWVTWENKSVDKPIHTLPKSAKYLYDGDRRPCDFEALELRSKPEGRRHRPQRNGPPDLDRVFVWQRYLLR